MNEPSPHGTFICEHCGCTYGKARPDDDARKESAEQFGLAGSHDCVVVCDTCFNELFADGIPAGPEDPTDR